MPTVDLPQPSDTRCGVAVLVPAYNEAEQIEATLNALLSQTCRPDRIVVVANNCTDNTLEIARAYAQHYRYVARIDVLEQRSNHQKKAGALNLALTRLLATAPVAGRYPRLADSVRYIVTIDADTVLDEHFINRAVRVLDADPRLGGVSAACRGKDGIGDTRWQRTIALFQRVEYARNVVLRWRANVPTMSGAGSVYRADMLDGLLDSRGYVFDPQSLVEDYALTLDLKQAGWRVTTNEHLVAYTDLMPTVRSLLGQRVRWTYGMLTELRARGFGRHTAQSFGAIALGFASLAYLLGWVAVSVATVTAHGWSPDWSLSAWGGLWLGLRVAPARSLGWRVMAFEALIVPELLFGLLRSYWLVKSISRSYGRTMVASARRVVRAQVLTAVEVWS